MATQTKNVIQTVRDTLYQVMEDDPTVIVLGEDVGRYGGVFGATMGFVDAFGTERVIDTPLAESSIVGVAIGASLNGLRPVAEIQFADFIYSAADQLISEAAMMYYRSNGEYPCPIVVRAPYGGPSGRGPYHSQSIESVFFGIPGLKIVAPSTPYDVKGLLRAAVFDPDPVLFLEHKGTYRAVRGEVPDEPYEIPIGVADVKRPGRDVTAISFGLSLHRCLEAAEALSAEGIEVEVIDLRSILPYDRDTVLASVEKTGKVLIVHEDNVTGGVGGELAAMIAQEAFFYLDAPIKRLGMPDISAIPYAQSIEAPLFPSTQSIAQALRELAAF
ncbi:MAG TPA: alpha-ketoacid dehydrogenase subunit beta [Limnochordia bacterium]